jgi:hypothetical protein
MLMIRLLLLGYSGLRALGRILNRLRGNDGTSVDVDRLSRDERSVGRGQEDVGRAELRRLQGKKGRKHHEYDRPVCGLETWEETNLSDSSDRSGVLEPLGQGSL